MAADRPVAHVANQGGLFSLDLARRPRLVMAAAIGEFVTINDVGTGAVLLSSGSASYYATAGLFDLASGRVTTRLPTYEYYYDYYASYSASYAAGAPMFAGINVVVPTTFCTWTYYPPYSASCQAALTTFSSDGTLLGRVAIDAPDAFFPQCSARSQDASVLLLADLNLNSMLAVAPLDGQTIAMYPTGTRPCPIAVTDDSATGAIVVGNDPSDARGVPIGSLLRLNLRPSPNVLQFLQVPHTAMVAAAADPVRGRTYAVARRVKRRGTIKRSILLTVDTKTWRIRRTVRLPRALGVVRSVGATRDGRHLLVGGERGVLVSRLRQRGKRSSAASPEGSSPGTM